MPPINVYPKGMKFIDYISLPGFNLNTIMYDKTKVGDIYFDSHSIAEDYLVWFKIFNKGITPYYLNEKTCIYRVLYSSRANNKFNALAQRFYFIRNYTDLNLINKIFSLVKYGAYGFIKNYPKIVYLIFQRFKKILSKKIILIFLFFL